MTGVAAVPGRASPSVDWGRCPEGLTGARCGNVTVVLDPADPSAGTIDIGFAWYRHRDRSRSRLGTIVATEGGPGYATTASADGYVELFDPLLERRDLLLVDNRGTGMSEPIACEPLQSYVGDYERAVGRCGRQLNAASDLYGTAFAADDLAVVLDALGMARVDLYGDSYGTFFGQTFAVRHPDRVRTLVLDAAYPVEDQDPWYRDLNRALRDAFRLACRRDVGCASAGGDPVARLGRLAARLRVHPLTGTAFDADGEQVDVTVDPGVLAYLAAAAAYGPPIYRELDAATRAYLRRRDPDPAPLLRLAAEQLVGGDAGAVEEYSEGLYVAAICNDYPQLWDIQAVRTTRERQYASAVRELRRDDRHTFSPFTIDDWLGSPWTEYRSCIRWPRPSNWTFPVPQPAEYPAVPTLVLAGDLDSLTSPEGARIVASRFPDATYVEVANGTHVAAIRDFSRCAADIVVRFVRTRSAGDTSCADAYNEIRLVDEFPQRAADLESRGAGGLLRGVAGHPTLVEAVAQTLGDVFPRWWAMYGEEGVGLRGGTFTTKGLDDVSFRLKALRWVEDVAVTGRMSWDRSTGEISARVRFVGPAGSTGRLSLRWNDWEPHARARVTGTIDGRAVSLRTPAP